MFMSSQENSAEMDLQLEKPLEQSFSHMDIAVLAVVLGIFSYWFFFKRKDSYDPNKIISLTSTGDEESESSFITKMKHTGKNLIIFFGSQTGTAEEFANRLSKEANRYGLKAMVADPEEYDMEDLSKISTVENSLALFCMATYGEGDPTDNAQEFHQLLTEGKLALKGLRYAVFGLGNRTYEHYNSMAKFVDKRLEDMGATRIFPLGLGDDDGSLEEDFIQWKEKFYSYVSEFFHVESLGDDVIFRQYKEIIHEDIDPEKVFTGELSRLNSYKKQRPPFDQKNPFLAPITEKRELYKGERSCLHLELDISGARVRYEAGDHVGIYPTNSMELVERLARLLDIKDLDTVFSLKTLDEDSSKQYPFPCPTTYRTAFQHYVDITSIPRTHILKEISEFASNEDEKKMLKSMGSSSEAGRNLYLTWVVKNCRSIIHILEDLPSVRPPVDLILELLPRLQARYYSISSSPKVYPSSVHVTAVLVDYVTPTNRAVKGVTTGWLNTLSVTPDVKPEVPVFIRKSQFKPPMKASTPIIMIGPGTGLAPFRGFLQERAHLKKQGSLIGDTILYFGCRKASEDFLYEEELKQFVYDGVLTKLYLAFSRDQTEKVYVTHLLEKNKEEIWHVIGEKNGHIYVCGDARHMAKDVHNIIVDVVKEFGKKCSSDAESYIKKMESQRRYSVDVWG